MAAPISVASVTTAGGVQLLAPNSSRKGMVIENSDANRLHVLLGSGAASATAFSFSLAQNENAHLMNYTGEVKGIWAADGAGSALISEY